MTKWVYSETVRDHFFAPRNLFSENEKFDFNAVGSAGSMKCGDEIKFYLKIENNEILDCRWETFGCASAIASSSILSEMIKKIPIKKALKITPREIAKKLGGLPENKIHCSVLGHLALRDTVKNFQKNEK